MAIIIKHQFKTVAVSTEEKSNIINKVINRVGISYPDWCHAIFETGCTFLETHLDAAVFRKQLLTDPQFKYWDWWYMVFVKDDEWILDFDQVHTGDHYIREKERLTHLVQVYENFKHYLNSIHTREKI